MLIRRPIVSCILICLFILFCTPHATPQTVPTSLDTGYPENSTFHGSDIDNVQLQNGNLHVTIPIWSAKGRALNTGYNFVYDNHGFRFTTQCFTSGGGFCRDTVTADPLSPMVLQGFGPLDYQFSSPKTGSFNCSGTWIYTKSGIFLREPDGTKHHFSPDPVATNLSACGYVMQSTLYADDGSGWTMQMDLANGVPAYATNKNGTKFIYSPTALKDSNGNQINWNSSTQQVTDTLGRVVLTNGSYYDSSGTLQSVSTTTTNGRITQITLPNGHGTYTFNYAPTMSTQICQFSTADECFESSSGGGEIASITLPTGGQISYTWGIWDEGGREVASRTISANGVTGTWNYVGSGLGLVVTDPSGKDMKFTSSVSGCSTTGTETSQYFDGPAATAPLIKTVQTDFNCQLATIFNGHVPLPIRVTTTWNQQNLVSKVETDWDLKTVATSETFSWKNPIEQREYDWGTGAPGALVRRTHYNYLHLQNAAYQNVNIADRPTSRIVYDGASNIIAQTTYTYDGSTVQGTTGAPGHDYTNYGSTNNIRGNATQTSRWVNPGGTWQNTTNTFNDLGDLLSTTDPRGNTTNFSYADNFTDGVNRNALAFVTQTTYPTTSGVSHIARKQYYWNTSLPAASCGQNFPTASACTNTASIPQPDYATFTYDLLNRSLNITRGDGGQTNFSYNDAVQPLSVSSTQSINASASLAKTTVLDGMGHVTQTQLTTDPDGTTYADTTYDAFGRVRTQSNPHRSTSASTDGATTTFYDALGRVCLVVPPDGTLPSGSGCPTSQPSNTIFTTHSGNTTTVTDQAGKARKSVTDALGRLTQVIEDPVGLAAIAHRKQSRERHNFVHV